MKGKGAMMYRICFWFMRRRREGERTRRDGERERRLGGFPRREGRILGHGGGRVVLRNEARRMGYWEA